MNKIDKLEVQVNPVISKYWAKNITVAGLITSEDLITTVQDIDADYIIIPSIMLKPYSDLFLDGNSISDVISATEKNLYIVKNNYSISEVIDILSQQA